jgi:peptidoglycan hydrolase CwlO-like protein
MANKDVWNYRNSLEEKIGSINAHVENIYHHIKRVDTHLDKQNGRIRNNEQVISKWKGVAVGILCVASFISTVIAIVIN